jgi:hypothetical protein
MRTGSFPVRHLLAILGLVVAGPAAAAAQPVSDTVPRVIRFNGTIPGAAGQTPVTIRLYRGQTDEAPIWSEEQVVEADTIGRYSVLLGSGGREGLPLDLFVAADARWLGVQAAGHDEQPRVLLVAVPYAMKAADADTIGGRPLSAFVLAGDTTGVGADGLTYVDTRVLKQGLGEADPIPRGGAGEPGYLGMFTGPTELGNSVLYQFGTNIGVGTTTPTAALHSVATSAPGAIYDVYSNALGALPVVFRAARGTPASPSAVQSNDILGGLAVRAYGATAFSTGRGQVMFKAAENWTDAAQGTYLQFTTTPIGTSAWVERMRIDPAGNIGVGTDRPSQRLTVAGTIESTAGGFKFPDGTTQPTAIAVNQIVSLQAQVDALKALVEQSTPAGAVLWARGFGGSGDDEGRSIALDSEGNTLVAGYFAGSVDFGGGPLTSAGGNDVFVAKYAPDGTHIWSRRFGASGNDSGRAIAVDASNNVYVTGTVTGTVDFGLGPIVGAGGYDIYVARLSPAGTVAWAKGFGGTGSDLGQGLAVDTQGNVLVTGVFMATVNFGGGGLLSSGATDIFVVKLTSTGAHAWSKKFGDGGDDSGVAIATDGSDNVVVTGHYNGTISFGGSPLTSAGMTDVFLAKFTSAGVHAWSKRFGSSNPDRAAGLAVAPNGDVVCGGEFLGSVSFGGAALTGVGGMDGFAARFTSSGTHLWSRAFGSAADDAVYGVAVDPDGATIVTGYTSGDADLGGGSLHGPGWTDVLMGMYAADGTHLWSEILGGALRDMGNAVAVDSSGRVVVTGFFNGTAGFGGKPLTSAGGSDVFVARAHR